MSTLLMTIGLIIAVVGGLWTLVETFKTGILWGIGSILVPFVSLIWLVTHWEEGSGPFAISVIGGVLYAGGAFLGG